MFCKTDEFVKRFFTTTLIIVLIKPGTALIAYDCANEYANISKISTVTINSCNFQRFQPEVSKEHIQLLQLSEESTTHVYQCKYEVNRLILHCGMHSHSSMVRGAFNTFIKEISREECLNIHRHRSLKTISGRIVDNILANGTTKFDDVAAGHVDGSANCKGGHFTDGKNEWDNVVVQYSITLAIRDFSTSVISSRDSVMIDGLRCDYSKEQCMDISRGQSFWTNMKDPSCYENQYDVLFEGLANKVNIQNPASGHNETVYSVVQGDTIFALQIRESTEICSTYGLKTEHPRLFIVHYIQSHKPFQKKTVNPKNLDMFTYINSKFVYTERHIRGEMDRMYKDMLTKICENERDLLQTQLSFAKMDPTAFAYARTREPGYTAVLLGEVVYLVKCVPTEVQIRESTVCYNELPVIYMNKSMFMTPQNHLLQPHGTIVECNTLMQPAFLLYNDWYAFFPAMLKVKEPDTLGLKTTYTWSYQEPGNLATAGIYSQKQLDGLKRQIMYPVEREVINNAIIRKILSPNEIDYQNLNIGNLIDENHIKSIFTKAWDKTWKTLTTVGDIMSAALGLWMICRVAKFIIDSVLHAYSLHNMYGWSWRILVMFWDALTYMLLRRGDRNPPQAADQIPTQTQYQHIYPSIREIQSTEAEIQQARVSIQEQPTPVTVNNPENSSYSVI